MDEAWVRLYPDLERDHFWWKIRREMITSIVEQEGQVAGLQILDVGCGTGLTLAQLAKAGATVRGVEIDEEFSVQESNPPGVVTYGDFLQVDVGPGFDVVLMMDVLEHLELEAPALTRAGDLLSPGGRLIVTVPAYGWLWSAHDEVNNHFRRYNRSELKRVLTQNGFEVGQCGYMFAGLVLPKLVLAWLGKLTERSPGHGRVPGSLMSALAERWFRLEMRLAIRRPSMLPFGTSVVAVARKA